MKKITLLAALLFLGINANAQCVAGYNAVAGAGAGDFEFTSTSSGSYQFIDFGDGSSTATSTGTVESHTFTANGTYDVCITVSDSDSAGNVSCSDTYCSTITVTGLSGCSAGFNAWQGVDSAGNIGPGPVVWVVDLSSTQSGGALSYLWDFGDGTTSTNQYPTHVYSQFGTFTLCLTIDDGLGCTDTYCEDITVTQKSMGFTLNVIAPGIASTVEEPELLTELTLFPNPTAGHATLELASAEISDIQVSIVSITGQIVSQELHQLNTGVNQIKLNTEALLNGYYFVEINSNDRLLHSIQFVKN